MTSCRKFFVDLETYSSVDLKKYGAFRYVDSDDFEILLIACAYDHDPVQVYTWDEFTMLFDGGVFTDEHTVKIAHNCAFERNGLGKALRTYMNPSQWQDTMIMASMNGLPLSLDAVGAALNLKNQKLKEGENLIRYFCKPTKDGTRHLPEDAPDKWERFKEYCKRDVEVERSIYYALSNYPVTPTERKVFELDARINERGILVDHDLADAAVEIDNEFKSLHTREMQRLTGLENPNSVTQLKGWLQDNGITVDSLGKNVISEIVEGVSSETVKKALNLRTQLSKTSTTKYDTLLKAENKDGRVRGILMYYGAGRTGRWAGRLFQPQNLPQNHLTNIGDVRKMLRQRDLDMLEMTFDNVPDILSQLIRTALIAKPGHTFLIADYSAIEARVIAYLAGEQWRMDVFKNGGDIYCSSASQMFKVPVEKHGVNGHLRQKGKVAELACGYGGGVGALKAFGADKMGLTEEEMQDIVNSWRLASPTIPKFWRSIEMAAKNALEHKGRTFRHSCGVSFCYANGGLRLKLPSERILTYWGAALEDGHIVYMGTHSKTHKWTKLETWGGKLVENIVQAFARDCLAVALLRLDRAGYNICFHVHDEIIAEQPKGSRWEDMAEIMGQPIPWAPGLLLRADGYETEFYMKD